MRRSRECLPVIRRALMERSCRSRMACHSIALFWNGKMTWEKVVAMRSSKDVILSETIGSNPRAQYSSWFIFPFDPYVLIVRTCSECKQLPQFHHCNFWSMVSWPRSCFRGVSSHSTFDGLYL